MQPIKVTLFGGPKTRKNYQLTALGKTKAEQYNVAGAKGEVMVSLENIGPCTITEIANDTKMTPNSAKQIVKALVRDGWARKVTAED